MFQWVTCDKKRRKAHKSASIYTAFTPAPQGLTMIVTTDEKTGRYRIKIDQIIDGKRVRKTKLMPHGFSLENSYRYAENLISGPVEFTFQDQLRRLIDGRSSTPGEVYFIKNPSIPGLVKIGMTRSTVHERINNLSTGHVSQWQIVCCALMNHPDIVEFSLHQFFAERREVNNREFFRITDTEALEAMTACQEIDGIDLSAVINAIGRKR